MAHERALEFYKIVRTSPQMWQDLATAQDESTMITKVMTLSAAQGIILTPEDIRAAISAPPDIIRAAPDDELELVSASDCGSRNGLQA